MPIEVGIWKLGDTIQRVQFTPMPSEKRIEDIIAGDIRILDPALLLIGRQVRTNHGAIIDLLAMDGDGNLIVIELKRDRTPREIIAQLLDYGSWVCQLNDEDIAGIFDAYIRQYCSPNTSVSLDEAFYKHFNVIEIPEMLNSQHELLVVASELDDSTERIVNYLNNEYGVAINAAFFRFFREGDSEYLTMAWLIDPSKVEVKMVERRSNEPWNGEYYVSFGEEETRHWVDGMKHGYIAAGGGSWYSKTLRKLELGSRIWVNVPGNGYVGVGNVLDKATPITKFTVLDESGLECLIKEVVDQTPSTEKPEDELEYYVRVDWIKAVPLEQAIKEKGFFGNQNIIAKPTTKKWTHTIERLKMHFNVQD